MSNISLYDDTSINTNNEISDKYESKQFGIQQSTLPTKISSSANSLNGMANGVIRNINTESLYLDVSDDGFWSKPDTVIPSSQQERRGRTRHSLDLNPYMLNKRLTPEQMTGYQVYYRIEELTKQIQDNDYSYCRIAQRERSPSPPPIYDEMGNRSNTRENRYKKKLDDERIKLIELAIRFLPNYNAPENYVKPNFFKEKFYVPVEEYKHINFVGLLLGPRGATLRNLQQQSGCRIQIRGKGSFKEGRSQEELPKGSMSISEPLHCLVIADSETKLKTGLKACESIVMKAITSPTGQNDLKREQLKELAKLNGTFRDTNSVACPLCGNIGHNRFNCPKAEKYLQTMQCNNCQQFGHLEQDCFVINRQKRKIESRFESHSNGEKYQKVDNENRIEVNYDTNQKQIYADSKEVDKKDMQISELSDLSENKNKGSKVIKDKDNEKEINLSHSVEDKKQDNDIELETKKPAAQSNVDVKEESHLTDELQLNDSHPKNISNKEISSNTAQNHSDEEELLPPSNFDSDEEELQPPNNFDSDDENLPPPPMNYEESE
ncbi:hypothetical protein QEN19_001897 [Hanseniaspora menglaensis]